MFGCFYYYDYMLVAEIRWMNKLNMRSFISKIYTRFYLPRFVNTFINNKLIRIRGCNSRVFKL